MPVFIYNIEKNGQLVKGRIQAQNIQIAKMRLKAQRLDPVYIKEKPLIPFFAGGGKINHKIVLFFTRQMSFLLSSGVSLLQALEMCVATSDNESFKQVLQVILKQLEAGKSFSKCLQSRPDVFDGFYINMIVCAEKTGLLDQVLKDLANYMENAEKIRSKVRSAMIYPAVILVISFCIITCILWFVVPQFVNFYGSTGGLPNLTQAFVNLSDILRANYLVVLAGIIGTPIFIYQYMKTEGGRQNIQSLLRTLPVFGKIQYQAALVRFLRSFHSLLKSGVNFLDALDVAKNVAEHDVIRRGIAISRDFVTKGKSFSKGLETSKAFPPLVYHMIKVGEESGKMEQTFENLTNYYEERLGHLIDGLIKMIEPLMIVFLGGIIGTMILALYLPVFNMGNIIN